MLVMPGNVFKIFAELMLSNVMTANICKSMPDTNQWKCLCGEAFSQWIHLMPQG